MRLVVSDTGPLLYLLLIGQIDLLPRLFEAITVPTAVRAEQRHPMAPQDTRAWIRHAPLWLRIARTPQTKDSALAKLDAGERAVIALAGEIKAELILMDDRAGVAMARTRGLLVIGTLGVLDLAARRSLVDLEAALNQLKATSFRYRPQLLDALLAQHRQRTPCPQ